MTPSPGSGPVGPSLGDLVAEVAARLPYLNPGDTVIVWRGPYYVEWSQSRVNLSANASANYPALPPEAHLGPERERRLASLGWNRPVANEYPNWWLRPFPWPMSATAGRRLAELLVATLREVYGAASTEDLAYTSFNDEGYPKPSLSTITAKASEAEDRRHGPRGSP